VDIRQKSDTIIVTASISHVIRQEKLNALESELQLFRAPENNELDCVHWAIKRVNLPQLIQEKKLIEIIENMNFDKSEIEKLEEDINKFESSEKTIKGCIENIKNLKKQLPEICPFCGAKMKDGKCVEE
jgi:DNA repair exonuclease SbcCD ATPase subunit